MFGWKVPGWNGVEGTGVGLPSLQVMLLVGEMRLLTDSSVVLCES